MGAAQVCQTEKRDNSASEEPEATSLGWEESFRGVTAKRNCSVYLITVWIYSSMLVLDRYFAIYFRDIGISYVLIGILFSVLFGIRLVGNFVSGYFADNYDRRKIAVGTMALSSAGYLLLSVSGDFRTLAVSMIIIGASAFTRTAGRAYYMEQIDRKFGGVAQSLFTLGTGLGLVPLYVVSILLNLGGVFVDVMRILLFIAGILYSVCAVIRATVLKSTKIPERQQDVDHILEDFKSENSRGLNLLAKVFPVFLAVLIVDALSDSFYRFTELYYMNETLDFGMHEINLILFITLLISVPLTLLIGHLFDKNGGTN
ncbi:MAG: MFS transporter [Promethearchaeia archaeon]